MFFGANANFWWWFQPQNSFVLRVTSLWSWVYFWLYFKNLINSWIFIIVEPTEISFLEISHIYHQNAQKFILERFEALVVKLARNIFVLFLIFRKYNIIYISWCHANTYHILTLKECSLNIRLKCFDMMDNLL